MNTFNEGIDAAISVVSQHPETVTKLIIAELKQMKKSQVVEYPDWIILWAREFSQMIKKEIGSKKFDELAKRNEQDAMFASHCHSHDYLDTNQTMIDLLESKGMSYGSEDFDRSCTRVWNCAKQNNFFINEK